MRETLDRGVDEADACWECEMDFFPPPRNEGERWRCGICGQDYSTCRMVGGDIVWEYAES